MVGETQLTLEGATSVTPEVPETYTGVLTGMNDSSVWVGLPNQEVDVLFDDVYVKTVLTDANGYYTFPMTFTSGGVLKVQYVGTQLGHAAFLQCSEDYKAIQTVTDILTGTTFSVLNDTCDLAPPVQVSRLRLTNLNSPSPSINVVSASLDFYGDLGACLIRVPTLALCLFNRSTGQVSQFPWSVPTGGSSGGYTAQLMFDDGGSTLWVFEWIGTSTIPALQLRKFSVSMTAVTQVWASGTFGAYGSVAARQGRMVKTSAGGIFLFWHDMATPMVTTQYYDYAYRSPSGTFTIYPQIVLTDTAASPTTHQSKTFDVGLHPVDGSLWAVFKRDTIDYVGAAHFTEAESGIALDWITSYWLQFTDQPQYHPTWYPRVDWMIHGEVPPLRLRSDNVNLWIMYNLHRLGGGHAQVRTVNVDGSSAFYKYLKVFAAKVGVDGRMTDPVRTPMTQFLSTGGGSGYFVLSGGKLRLVHWAYQGEYDWYDIWITEYDGYSWTTPKRAMNQHVPLAGPYAVMPVMATGTEGFVARDEADYDFYCVWPL